MYGNRGVINVPWHQHRHGARFDRPFPSMSRPECIGVCSIDARRDYVDDASGASYLVGPPWPPLPIDLNAGIEDVIRKSTDFATKDLEFVLLYIRHHKEQLLRRRHSDPHAFTLDTDFVTLRGILRQIMCMQYEWNREFRIKATRLNGTIYMAKEETPEQRLESESMTRGQLDMCSWGFKFEQYVTSKEAQGKPVTDVPVNEAEEFMAMFRGQLAGLRLLFGAEMDCVVSKEPVDFKDPKVLDSLKFVELKTSAHNMNHKQLRSFDNYKSANWWSQSFLVGIQTIYAGLRDSRGLVQEIKEYDVRSLARNKPWSPSAMAWFLEQFLRKLKELLVALDDPLAVVQVTFRDRMANYEVLRGPEHQILPDWYREMLKTE
ncbi:decapping and exoribonuclease protein Rai1 [Drosophila takahashii]|uniref:decapping and exoribonuclease protein Rai1 n=1 Tax=Drosophila takahashii TaxID=29030 RepID=UPI001CF83E5F|nr:decapping nuclease DXO homolog [Drosophila takahashii]